MRRLKFVFNRIFTNRIIFGRVHKIAKSFVMSVCPCIRVEQFGSYRTVLLEIWLQGVFFKIKPVEQIQDSLNSEKINVHFT